MKGTEIYTAFTTLWFSTSQQHKIKHWEEVSDQSWIAFMLIKKCIYRISPGFVKALDLVNTDLFYKEMSVRIFKLCDATNTFSEIDATHCGTFLLSL